MEIVNFHTSGEAKRIWMLDLFRMLFLLMIIYFHWGVVKEQVFLTRLGGLRQSYFFVISAFLISLKYGKVTFEWNWRYFKSKCLLLYPLSWISTTATLLLTMSQSISVNIKSFLCTFFLIHAWFPDPAIHYSLYGGHLWFINSLLFCFFFYGFLSKLIYRFKLHSLWIVTFTIGISYWVVLDYLPVYTSDYLYVLPPMRLIDFSIGILLARTYKEARWLKNERQKAMILAMVTLLSIIILAWSSWRYDLFIYQSQTVLWWLPIIALIWSCISLSSTLNPKWLISPLEKYFTPLFLTLYIFQMVPAFAANNLIKPLLDQHGMSEYYHGMPYSFVILVCLVPLLHRFVTRPLKRLIKRKYG